MNEDPAAGEFPLAPELCYLNHAAVAPWPRRAAAAVARFAEENAREGARHYPRWLETEQRLRQRLARLLNAASADDIALLKTTSEALSVVAHGLAWRAGDNVIISDEEFPSNRIVWESLAPLGVEVRRVNLHRGEPEAALLGAMDDRTRLLSVSSVQYASGLRLDLPALGRGCRERGVLFCVDAIQSLGALAADVAAWQADFVMADGHKWMLGPEGLAVFWCRPELRETLVLHQYGWHMVEHHDDFDRLDWRPAPTARRFECGSPNMLGIHALEASLSLLQEVGLDEVEARLLDRSRRLLEAIAAAPELELVSDTAPGRVAGIVTFRHRRLDPETLHRHLTARGVVCARRGPGVRFSPHFYTPVEVLDRAVALAAAA